MSDSKTHYDIAIVGSGVVGLAHAYHAARTGKKVILFERDDRAIGASIRNFGMIWPIGQPAATLERALRSRRHWLTLAEKAGFWASTAGSLHLAYHEDELAVLTEFAEQSKTVGYDVALYTPAQTLAASPAVNPTGLLGALYSRTEVNIDPRQAILHLHLYLREQLGVTILYRHTIREIAFPFLRSGNQHWTADQIIVASGQDFSTLYPELFAQAPLQRCKLQMMRTAIQPKGWDLGPNLAAGLTLQHYASFANCASLPALKTRIQQEIPNYNTYGIHVMVSQTARGELTIGDSHEYGHTLDPFDQTEINELILDYLRGFARIPTPTITEYWHGIYPKLTNGATELILAPEACVIIVNGLGGAGMTLSLGLAEEVLGLV